MQLSDLIADIQDELNKGTSITEARVSRHIKQALQMLEMKHNWAYMNVLSTFTVDADGANPRRITAPDRVKKYLSVRLSHPTINGGDFLYLNEVDLEDVLSVESSLPSAVYKEGTSYLWMNNTPSVDYNGEIYLSQYTQWSDADAFEPWLFEFAWTLVKYRTLLYMSSFVREVELRSLWKEEYEEALKDALDANEEFTYGNMKMQMGFGH